MSLSRLRMFVMLLVFLVCLALLTACSNNYSPPSNGGTPAPTSNSGY